MKCQMLVLLQILYLEFQNSPSDYPNQIGIKTILNWKYYLLIRISEERYHRIWKTSNWYCEKYIKFFCRKLTFKIFFHHSNPFDLFVISLVYLNFSVIALIY